MEAAEGGVWIWRSISGNMSECVLQFPGCQVRFIPFLVFLSDCSSRVGIEVSCTSVERNWGSSPGNLHTSQESSDFGIFSVAGGLGPLVHDPRMLLGLSLCRRVHE